MRRGLSAIVGVAASVASCAEAARARGDAALRAAPAAAGAEWHGPARAVAAVRAAVAAAHGAAGLSVPGPLRPPAGAAESPWREDLQDSSGRFLHAFCEAGLRFLVDVQDFLTLARLTGICDDGRALVLDALMAHGLEYGTGLERKGALEFFATIAHDMRSSTPAADQSELALRCLRFLWERVCAEHDWHSSVVAEDAIVRLTGEWAEVVDGGASARVVGLIAADLASSDRSRASVRLLARLATELTCEPSLAVLLGQALRVGEARAYAAQRISDVAVRLAAPLASQCVVALQEAALHDKDREVRYQAALSLTRLANETAHEPGPCATECIAALTDVSAHSARDEDRQFAGWRLLDLARTMRGLPGNETEDLIGALTRMAREDAAPSVRASAAAILSELALSFKDEAGRHVTTRSLDALKEMATNAEWAADREAAVWRLYSTAHNFGQDQADLARSCATVLSQQSRNDPDPEVRNRASGLLIDLWYERASAVRWAL